MELPERLDREESEANIAVARQSVTWLSIHRQPALVAA